MYDVETTENTPPKPAISSSRSFNRDVNKIESKARGKTPKLRTRTGCFTCRKRKKKCDGKGPVCSGCSRNFISCVWPEHSAQNLPKQFEITSATIECPLSGHHDFGSSRSVSSDSNASVPDVNLAECLPISKELVLEISVEDNFKKVATVEAAPLITVPSKLCTVFEISNYKHSNSLPKSVVIPNSIDFVIDSLSANVPSPSPSTNSSTSNVVSSDDAMFNTAHSISQMFDSLYSDPSHSSDDIDAFYNDLLSYNSKVSLPNVSVKNPVLAAFREIFYARGCLYLAKNENLTNNHSNMNEQYSEASKRHYDNAASIVRDNVAVFNKKPNMKTHWKLLAIQIVSTSDRIMGLTSESCILNTITNTLNTSNETASFVINDINNANSTNLNLDKVLMSHMIFTYPFLIYFSDEKYFATLLPPHALYQNYSSEIAQVLFNDTTTTGYWLDNIIYTAIINIYQNLSKLMWLMRIKYTLEAEEISLLLKEVKNDMALIWTTIQTAEVQSESTINTLIEFAKFAHMSLEIMFVILNDSTTLTPSSPIIGFYTDQLIANYDSYMQHTKQPSATNGCRIQDSFLVLPLFIAACSAQTLYHKEHISKELYIHGKNLGIEFVESLASKIEDVWCLEQNNSTRPFTQLLQRDTFLELVS